MVGVQVDLAGGHQDPPGSLEFTKIFILEYDSLGHGSGVVLMQEGNPLHFESTGIKGKNLLRPIYEKKI